MSRTSHLSNATPKANFEYSTRKNRGSVYNRDIVKGSSTLSHYKHTNIFDAYLPPEVPLTFNKTPLSQEDLEYIATTDKLKAYLRKKQIHAKIFKAPEPIKIK